MKRKNELSIVMMIEKLQSADDFIEQEVNSAYIKDAVEHSPKYLLDIMSQIVEVLLAKLNIPQEEIDDFARQIKEHNMAELFANFKAYDVQAARAEAQRLGLEEGRAKGLAEGRAEALESGIEKLIKAAQNFNMPQEKTLEQLVEQYDLTEAEAVEKLALYWK